MGQLWNNQVVMEQGSYGAADAVLRNVERTSQPKTAKENGYKCLPCINIQMCNVVKLECLALAHMRAHTLAHVRTIQYGDQCTTMKFVHVWPKGSCLLWNTTKFRETHCMHGKRMHKIEVCTYRAFERARAFSEIRVNFKRTPQTGVQWLWTYDCVAMGVVQQLGLMKCEWGV